MQITRLIPAMTVKRQPLIELKQVNVVLDNQPILNDINLTILPNSITTIVGPNGGGKSTLLKVLLRLFPQTSGQIIHQKHLRIGYVPQKLHLEYSVPITVKKFLQLRKKIKDVEVEAILSLFSIAHLTRSSMHTLSGGELQRVLLARAMLNKPHLLVLDEPMQGVDIVGQTELYQLLNQIRTDFQCAILMVSHDLNIVMANTDEVLCINRHICCAGPPEMVSTDPKFIHFFGDKFAQNVAFYAHKHNHHHNLHGDVCQNVVCSH